MDELEEGLKRRDRRFLFRVVLLVGLTAVGGVWLLETIRSADVGGCFARGFSNVTESPPP